MINEDQSWRHPHIVFLPSVVVWSPRLTPAYPSAYPAKIHLHIHIPATYSRISFKYPSAYPPNIHPHILQISIRISAYPPLTPAYPIMLGHFSRCNQCANLYFIQKRRENSKKRSQNKS